MPRYRTDRVDIAPTNSVRSTWTFAGRSVRGIEYQYDVTDRNHASRNRWAFVVRLPHDPYGRIEVRPVVTPNHSKYAGLDRRSITFMRGTRHGYRSFRYCPLALAVASGRASRVIVRSEEKPRLPLWLRRLGWRLKKKETVRATRGTDGSLLVVLVRPDDHRFMIGLFLATKAWVLKEGFALE
jgi:hypothetical protein